MKKYLFVILFCSIILALFVYGCCSKGGGGSAVFVNTAGGSEITYREIFIDEKGRLPTVSFPSGAKIKAEEEMTLQPGIKVILAEQKLLPDDSNSFTESSNSSIYIYKITAIMKSDNPLVSDTLVTTLEKPFTITIPNNKNITGQTYVGVSEDETSPWRFFLVSDSNNDTGNVASLRTTEDLSQIEYRFKQYRLGTRFTIRTYNNQTNKLERIPETVVNNLIASAPSCILVKNDKYIQDLNIKGLMKGLKLDSFKPSNFIARITYRNNTENVAKIKANGTICQQTTEGDKTVPGKSFVHSFIVSNITDASLMTGEGEFNFTINLKGIETELFPTDFLVELYNKIEGENIFPYIYTEYLTLKKSERVILALSSDDGNQISDENSLYRCSPSFTITSDYDFSDSDKAKIASAVRIIKLNDEDENLKEIATEATQIEIEYVTEGVNKEWNEKTLRIFLNKNLDSDTSYRIVFSEIKDIEGITIVPFEDFTFKTVGDAVFSIAPKEDSIINAASQTYNLQPTFYITTNYDSFTQNDWNSIADSISVSNLNEGIASKTISNNSLVLSFIEELATDTEYSISMNEINDLNGINSVPFDEFKFKTQGIAVINASFTITSDQGNVFDSINSLYRLNPRFTITSDYADFSASDKEKIAESILVSNGGSDIASLTWNDNILNLSFGKNLATDTEYEISMGDLSKLEGFSIATFSPITFKTMGSIVFTVTPDEDNIYVAMTPKYQCLPGFTITPNYQLTDDNKAIIADAISVSNSDNTTKTWEGNELKIGFSSNLAPDTSYTLAMSDVNSITGVTVTPFNSVDFTTLATLTFALTPEASNIFVAGPPELYHCKPEFTLTPSFILNEEDKTTIANAISINNNANDKLTKIWDDNELKIGFSSNLVHNTEHTISMSAVENIKGVTITPFSNTSFTTIDGLNITIASDSGDVFVIENGVGLYQTLPTFTVTSNMALSEEDQTKIANVISVSNVASNKIDKSWANATTLNISFTENLAHNTNYTISMADVDDISGVSVGGFSPLTFKTMNALTFTAADVDGNLFVTNPSVLYQCRPSFTVTPNYTLNEENRTKIANAVTVSNANNITKTWNNNILTVSFSSDLALSSAHTLSMGAVNDITGVSVTPFANKSFTTIGAITFTATPDDSNVYTAMNPKYHCKPAFTITPNYSLAALSEASRTALLDAVTISNSSGVTKAWDGNNIRVTCSTNLAANAHSLSMSEVDFTGITVTPFANLDFSVLDTLTFTVTPDAGNVYTALSPKYNCQPSYTITTSFTLNEEDKTKIKNAISVSNTESIIHKEWQGNSLVITFSENLTSNTAYTLSMESVSGMPNVNITNFSNQTFTTIPQLTFNITSANTNVFYDGKYHCNPTFTITPNFAIDSSYNSAIEGSVSVSGVSPSNVSKTWNGNNLLLGFNNYIATSTDYTISMSAINNLTGVNVTSLSNFDFSTIPDLIVSLATSTTTLVKKANSSNNVLEVNGKNYCYCSGSSFTISTNMTLNQTNKDKIFGAVSLTGINSSLVNKGWNEEKIAISFNDTLPASTSYSIQMSAINDINGVTVKPFSTFTTTSFYHLGKGTEANPFTIYTPAQLACLDLYPGEAYYYKQMVNLDLSSYDNWEPIGSSTLELHFYGIYDGNNKKISNATISYPNVDYVGLFSYTDRSYNSNTSIKNLTLEDFTVNGKSGVGALAGYAFRCELNNISVIDSSITGDDKVGGIAGFAVSNYSKVLNVTAENLTVTGRNDVAGLFGYNQNNTKENCGVINSNITSTGGTCGGLFAYSTNYTEKSKDCFIRNSVIRAKGYCGGYAGLLTNNNYANYLFEGCSVENCKIIRENDGNYTGGFIGIDDSRLSATYQSCNVASVTISSTGSYVGGFAGSFKGLALNSCNVASISMDTSGNYIGGLVGYNEGSITSCYVASISMNTGGNYIGGLVGYSNGGNITNCYTDKADITARLHSVGGLVGMQTSTGSIENCHVTKANVRFATVDNMQCYGGLVGQSAGTVNKCYVDQSSVSALQQVGGIVGYFTGGSITKSFIINSNIRAQDVSVGGICGEMYDGTQIDSCYVKGCNIAFTEEELSDRIGGLAATCKSSITNSYTYNTTITGRTGYGALAGVSEENGSISNCFISEDYSTLIKENSNTNPLTNCYYNVNNLSTFNDGPWSTGAWSNFNTTSFPPQLVEVPEPAEP